MISKLYNPFSKANGSRRADFYPVTGAPEDVMPGPDAHRNNSTGPLSEVDKLALERWKIRELVEGWGMFRDAHEFDNYRSMFWPDDNYIATSWKQGTLEEFIQASVDGFSAGKEFLYIGHRMLGCAVDIQGDRAIAKLKVQISCRFTIGDIETDNEADCRFFFFLSRREGRWKANYFTLLFDKDKMIPVNPNKVLPIPEAEVAKYPSGYKYLAWIEDKIKRPPKLDLNSHGPERDILYGKCKAWLEGQAVQPNLTGTDVITYK